MENAILLLINKEKSSLNVWEEFREIKLIPLLFSLKKNVLFTLSSTNKLCLFIKTERSESTRNYIYQAQANAYVINLSL